MISCGRYFSATFFKIYFDCLLRYLKLTGNIHRLFCEQHVDEGNPHFHGSSHGSFVCIREVQSLHEEVDIGITDLVDSVPFPELIEKCGMLVAQPLIFRIDIGFEQLLQFLFS